MFHLRQSDYRQMPWKNGLGLTTEIARFPLDGDFLWRVSTARVEHDGPFSRFEGCDRIIVALDGGGMTLTHAEDGREALLGELEPYPFSGDWDTTCTLRGGPVRDFNVITRRGEFNAHVSVMEIARPVSIDTDASLVLLHAVRSSFVVRGGDGAIGEGETLFIRTAEDGAVFEVAPFRGPAVLLRVEISAAASPGEATATRV